MAVGYLAELLQAFFGNGARFGIEINYSFEDKPLGTVGPLTLIESLADERDFLVMNGDVLTTIDYSKLIERHRASGADVTIATYRREVKIDFLGFTIENKFVVGYGLDVAQQYRNLPYIGYVQNA